MCTRPSPNIHTTLFELLTFKQPIFVIDIDLSYHTALSFLAVANTSGLTVVCLPPEYRGLLSEHLSVSSTLGDQTLRAVNVWFMSDGLTPRIVTCILGFPLLFSPCLMFAILYLFHITPLYFLSVDDDFFFF